MILYFMSHLQVPQIVLLKMLLNTLSNFDILRVLFQFLFIFHSLSDWLKMFNSFLFFDFIIFKHW